MKLFDGCQVRQGERAGMYSSQIGSFMKKIIVAVIVSMTFAFGAKGSGVFVKIGVAKGGIKGAGMDSLFFFNHHPVESNTRVAPSIDIGYEQSFFRVISASAGAGMRMIGNEYHAEFVTMNDQAPAEPPLDRDLYFTYLSFPVSVKFLLPVEFGGFFCAGGPRFNFLMNNETNRWDNGSDFLMELGFRCGAEIALKKHRLFLESGYDFGLNTIAKFNDESEKMGTFTILALGFRFNLSKSE
jgi:hypothetical protein